MARNVSVQNFHPLSHLFPSIPYTATLAPIFMSHSLSQRSTMYLSFQLQLNIRESPQYIFFFIWRKSEIAWITYDFRVAEKLHREKYTVNVIDERNDTGLPCIRAFSGFPFTLTKYSHTARYGMMWKMHIYTILWLATKIKSIRFLLKL